MKSTTPPSPVRRTFLAAATTAAIVLAAGLPSAAMAETSSVAEVIEAAEAVAVGTPTPAGAAAPEVQDAGAAVTVELNASDVQVALGVSADATISESGQYATVQDETITYAVSHPEDGATRFSAVLAAPTEANPRWTFESGTQLLLLENGAVSVSDGTDFLGGIDAPPGQSMPTDALCRPAMRSLARL